MSTLRPMIRPKEVLARLEKELRSRQAQLVSETARNMQARAQVSLLQSLALARDALRELLGSSDADDAPETSEAATRGPSAPAEGASVPPGGTEPAMKRADGAESDAASAPRRGPAAAAARPLLAPSQRRASGDEGAGSGLKELSSGEAAAIQAFDAQVKQLRQLINYRSCAAADKAAGGAAAAGGGGGGLVSSSGSDTTGGNRADTVSDASGSALCGPALSEGSTGASGTAALPSRPPARKLPWRGEHSCGRFLQRLVGTPRFEGGKDAFLAWWRARVMELAMLLHQMRAGVDVEERLELCVFEMSVRFGANFVREPWAIEVMMIDQETGVVCEAPQSLWDRVAASMALTPDQAAVYLMIDKWWRSSMETLQRDREALAQWALRHPHDLDAQEEVARGLERVNAAYLVDILACMATSLFGIMEPFQVAESMVSAWPRMVLMTALFAALRNQHALSCA